MKSSLPFLIEERPSSTGDDVYSGVEYRVLIFAPSANDTRITIGFLRQSGITGVQCGCFEELADAIKQGCGALIVADETLVRGTYELTKTLESQPPWSDLPITIVTSTRGGDGEEFGLEAFAKAALNATVLERPFRPDTLLSTIKVALRARRRQYEVRDLLAKLQNGEIRVRGILDSISDAFMTVDPSWRITYVNAALYDLVAPLFPAREDLTGRILWDVFPDLENGPIGDLYRRVMEEGSQQTLETFHEPLMAWLEIRAFPSAYALSLYIRNITPRREAEEALRLAKEKAEASSESKDRFLAVLSHELRTPLTPVLMVASARATDPAVPPPVRDEMAMIRRNVELETKLIDDLLDLSRITTGKLHLSFESVRVNEMVAQVCEICRSEVEAQGLTINLVLSPDVDGIRADASRFQQILWNLIKNAAKFTPRGGSITITTTSQDGCIVIEVSDTGIGIDPENLTKIFDAFEQGDVRRTREFGGLGLGLAITQALVTLHDGTIRAQSEGIGRGSTFTIEMPSIYSDLVAAKEGADAPASASRATILLVEDHHDTGLVLKALLEQRGYSVILATSVAEALATAAEQRFEILLSDIGLPDSTGYQLIRSLKDLRHFRGIAMSGYGMEEDIRKSLEAGFEKHLVKPVNINALENAIKSLTAEKKQVFV
jgi:signal transduction histidine kinase/ActR/RegA family two-component response regulator